MDLVFEPESMGRGEGVLEGSQAGVWLCSPEFMDGREGCLKCLGPHISLFHIFIFCDMFLMKILVLKCPSKESMPGCVILMNPRGTNTRVGQWVFSIFPRREMDAQG